MDRFTIRNSDGSVSQPTDLAWCNALYKLAEYEDEAEQREKGCGKCDTTQLKTLHPDYKFCPYCGRKLGGGENGSN